jgi:hypothetical protein
MFLHIILHFAVYNLYVCYSYTLINICSLLFSVIVVYYSVADVVLLGYDALRLVDGYFGQINCLHLEGFWRQYVPLKRQYPPISTDDVTTQKASIDIFTNVTTTDLTFFSYLMLLSTFLFYVSFLIII